MSRLGHFPPPPVVLKGRAQELATLTRALRAERPLRIAFIGAGGSGKSLLACALGHKLSRTFSGRIDWFRVGRWDYRTVLEMLCLGFGIPPHQESRERDLHEFFSRGGERLVVLDNHEDDVATARILNAFADTPVTFLITARRCLLSGVLIYPVTAPLATTGRHAFPRVKTLTHLLRFNPLALDIANAIVTTRALPVAALRKFLVAHGVSHCHVIDHEDDLPEVALLVKWAWQRLSPASRRMLGVLAHMEGDHMSLASLAQLAKADRRALASLVRWHLVQEPLAGRYTLHAVVRHAVRRVTKANPQRIYDYYMKLLENDPASLALEQTHFFAAMDHAQREGNFAAMLRIERLLSRLEKN